MTDQRMLDRFVRLCEIVSPTGEELAAAARAAQRPETASAAAEAAEPAAEAENDVGARQRSASVILGLDVRGEHRAAPQGD